MGKDRVAKIIKDISVTEATPHDWMSWLGERAYIYANANLTMWDVLPQPSLQGDPDLESEESSAHSQDGEEKRRATEGQLTLELLCNIAANRSLLESARIGALSAQAADAAVKLLKVLNEKGIVAVPEVETDDDIQEVLSTWFGRVGLILSEPGFQKPLQGDAMEIVMHHAAQVHVHYLHTRASGIGDFHRSAQHKFIFALALVACLYGEIELGISPPERP